MSRKTRLCYFFFYFTVLNYHESDMVINGHQPTFFLFLRSHGSIWLHVDIGLLDLNLYVVSMGFSVKICWHRMKYIHFYNLICDTQWHSKSSNAIWYNNLVFRNLRLTSQEIFPWQKTYTVIPKVYQKSRNKAPC